MSNPKSAVFFATIFATALPPSAPLATRLIAVSIVAAIAGVWYVSVAVILSTQKPRLPYLRARPMLYRFANLVMVLFALRVLVSGLA